MYVLTALCPQNQHHFDKGHQKLFILKANGLKTSCQGENNGSVYA